MMLLMKNKIHTFLYSRRHHTYQFSNRQKKIMNINSNQKNVIAYNLNYIFYHYFVNARVPFRKKKKKLTQNISRTR